jgi:hypothetical protein
VPSRITADLARVIPRGAALPCWARFLGHSWAVTHRLVVPLFGPAGEMESIHARSLAAIVPGGQAKAASPTGYEVAGLVMANAPARAMLESGELPSGELLVVEGLPDFLAAAVAEPERAVLGILSGSFTPEIAARVPARARVEIRTHDDRAGERYAAQIAAALAR